MAFHDQFRAPTGRRPGPRFGDAYMLMLLAALMCIVLVTVFARQSTHEVADNDPLAGLTEQQAR
jgi:hypothetical protein